MATDNGDLEPQGDKLDAMMRSHARGEPPADLLDRCLATVAADDANAASFPQAVSIDQPASRAWRPFRWVRWAAAACLVAGVGFMCLPAVEQAREAARRAQTRNNLSQPGQAKVASERTPQSYHTDNGRYLAAVDREKQEGYFKLGQPIADFRDGVSNTVMLGEVVTGEELVKVWGRDSNGKSPQIAFGDGAVASVAPPATHRALAATTYSADGSRVAVSLDGVAPPSRALLPDVDRGWAVASVGVEHYARTVDNSFVQVSKAPLSTFSVDVDTASYSNVRRFLSQGSLPPRDAVRVEELVNYFSYDYPAPRGDDPFAMVTELAGCPWNAQHRLLRVGLKAREVARQTRPSANLVFLIDVSGSMQPENKLPLLKTAMQMLLEELRQDDRVAVVTYSDTAALRLASTSCEQKATIHATIDALAASGSTNGAGGIQLAYETALKHLVPGGVNRVILATDGDFNVGITDAAELVRYVQDKCRSGVFLSVLGFGMGNLKDARLEQLADEGDGHYAYIDTLAEARRVLVEQMNGTLVTVAKDVKVQIEFNPAMVGAYRLIGYENRSLAPRDFNDDRKDAGDVGAGHAVTALYEIVPASAVAAAGEVDPLKYQPQHRTAQPPANGELLTLKLRFKRPDREVSERLETAVSDTGRAYGQASVDFKFAAAVAAFGMVLRDSPHRGTATFDAVLELASEGLGPDRDGRRAEFIGLVRQAQNIRGR
jgi:Ca-activated chloride channel family protein